MWLRRAALYPTGRIGSIRVINDNIGERASPAVFTHNLIIGDDTAAAARHHHFRIEQPQTAP
jgi:hypothetical protein